MDENYWYNKFNYAKDVISWLGITSFIFATIAAVGWLIMEDVKRVMLDDIERELVERTFETRFSHKCDEESIMRLHKTLTND